jgi:hypothetical protein
MTILDEATAKQLERRDGAMSVRQFCAWANIGRTTAYAEIKAGRLRAKKCGCHTIITFDDARWWLKQLPNKSSNEG